MSYSVVGQCNEGPCRRRIDLVVEDTGEGERAPKDEWAAAMATCKTFDTRFES
jgi:hypothetical protein